MTIDLPTAEGRSPFAGDAEAEVEAKARLDRLLGRHPFTCYNCGTASVCSVNDGCDDSSVDHVCSACGDS